MRGRLRTDGERGRCSVSGWGGGSLASGLISTDGRGSMPGSGEAQCQGRTYVQGWENRGQRLETQCPERGHKCHSGELIPRITNSLDRRLGGHISAGAQRPGEWRLGPGWPGNSLPGGSALLRPGHLLPLHTACPVLALPICDCGRGQGSATGARGAEAACGLQLWTAGSTPTHPRAGTGGCGAGGQPGAEDRGGGPAWPHCSLTQSPLPFSSCPVTPPPVRALVEEGLECGEVDRVLPTPAFPVLESPGLGERQGTHASVSCISRVPAADSK